jgi:hypothetical protein
MAAEVKKEIELEIAHVLFADIVGYSKLPMWERALSMVPGDGVSRVGRAGVPANARGDMQPYQETGDAALPVFGQKEQRQRPSRGPSDYRTRLASGTLAARRCQSYTLI